MNEYSDDKIFKNDPIYMKSLVGREVEIETVDKKIHRGTVYVIDPIFKTVVLHTNFRSEEEFQTVFILRHAIESLKTTSEVVKESYLKEPAEKQVASHINQKKLVTKWLKHMQIDVQESGDYLKIDDHLVIVPPYGPENCICNNTLILEQIQKLLKSLPEEFS
ncbi:unnamed protein product [Phaedon cochleariae]|uniref:AD domain-containing protein n=1 Tax=Phaedon cochleariae TaxID=80249 RepID=A0A9N9X0J2_PHACE|nr:unnamed protein product [Phaedon cochleariae]